MLSESDLEVNVLEFRQRSFSFRALADVAGASYAVFDRTETESESQFRPRLVRLHLVVPQDWVVLDEASDALRIARDGHTVPPHLIETVIEVGAEPPTFQEQGVEWTRHAGRPGHLVYCPRERAEALLAPTTLAALGVPD